MILVEWVEVRKFLIGGSLLIIALVVPFVAHRRKWRKQFRYRMMSLALGVLGLLFISWGWSIVTSNDVVDTLYSPDGQSAVRISIGPFGEQAVELFSMHGLRKEVVYRGDTSSMHWTDSTHLVLEQRGPGDYGEGKSCPGSRIVVVRCVTQP
jgi:Na+/melibiose symporter-like transporter